MERKLRIRGREHRFEELDDLVAVYPEGPECLHRVRSGHYGVLVSVADRFAGFATALDDALAFEKRGWIFLLAPAADWPRLHGAEEGLFVARVFLDPSGRLMLAPGGLTVKLRPDFPVNEAKSFFENADVEIVRQLRFGRNLFEVRARRAVDAFDLSERLTADADVEYAEPKLLEHIESRQAGAAGR